MSSEPKEERGTPWWVVFGVFVVLPVAAAYFISREAGAQQIRRKAIASAHGWAVEVKNEGQRGWILRGFHRDAQFEAVHLLRVGGGNAWRVRMPVAKSFPSWLLVATKGTAWQPGDFGTISTLVTRTELPPVLMAPPAAWSGFQVFAPADEPLLALDPLVKGVATLGSLKGEVAVSLVDDGVVLDGQGPLPEGEALVPYLDFASGLAQLFSADAG